MDTESGRVLGRRVDLPCVILSACFVIDHMSHDQVVIGFLGFEAGNAAIIRLAFKPRVEGLGKLCASQ
ncbi:MAG TPA: hypothetical protein VGK19_02310 [Capsulimonadaceae bacterium]